MCVMLYKPANQYLPVDLMNECFRENPHGAGYMYPHGDEVVIKKGFMKFSDLMNSVCELTSDQIRKTPILFHFRISTQAGVNRACTHPYPVCDNYNEMKKLSNSCPVALAHNGVLLKYSFKAKNHNDSMQFIHDFVSLLVRGPDDLNEGTIAYIKREIGMSRIAIMTPRKIHLLGHWVTMGGFRLSHPVQWDF